jgi:hypothetical protein
MPWRALFLLVALTFGALASGQSFERIDDELVVEYGQAKTQVSDQVTEFSGGVVATYGMTVVRSDRLRLDLVNRTGVAEGAVRVDDPEGTLTANLLRFDWANGTGEAENVDVVVGNVRVKVRRLVIQPDLWVLEDAFATPCGGERRPSLVVSARRVELRPGRNGRAIGPRLRLFGADLGTIPFADRFSLDNRVTGLRLPSVASRRGEGIGVSWSSSLLLDDQTAISGTFSKFPKSAANYGATLAWSAIPPTRSTGLITPRTELGERFSDGYFDRVDVEDPAAEDAYVRAERRTAAVASQWNQGTRGRLVDSDGVSKRWEIAAEAGSGRGDLGGFVQARVQSIRPDESRPFRERVTLYGAATASRRLGPGLDARIRLDASAFGGQGSYGWVRATNALVYRPIESMRLGAALMIGGSTGRAQFGFDRLFSHSAVHLRADARLGPIQTSYLMKYDFGRRQWYDQEYAVSLIAGCFEPFVVWRRFPSDTKFGVRLRIDSLANRLTRREIKR